LSKDNEVEYREMGPGSFFGEIAVLFLIKRTANVIAKTKCVLGVITSTEFQILLRDYPELATKIRLEAEQRYTLFKERYIKESLDEESETSTICDQIHIGAVHDDLLKIPLFMNCSETFIHSLSLTLQPRKYAINQRVIKRGDKGKEMFVLMSGECEVLDADTNEVLTTIQPGMFFGEIAIMMNIDRTEDVVAITPVEVYVISSDAVKDLLNAYPGMKEKVEKASKTTYNLWKIRETRKVFYLFLCGLAVCLLILVYDIDRS
jgi:F-box/leucine-rich repeat protein 7